MKELGSKASREHADVDPRATRTSVGRAVNAKTTPM